MYNLYVYINLDVYTNIYVGGTWVAQLVERLTLGFNSGHDLRVLGLSPTSGSVFCRESAGGFYLSLPEPLLLLMLVCVPILSLPLQIK